MPTKYAGDTINASDLNLKPDVWAAADLAALAALNPNPTFVTGLSYGLVPGYGLYRYDSASVAIADSPDVITAAPGGRWLLDAAPITRLTAPGAPTLAVSAGEPGTLALVSAQVVARTSSTASFVLDHNWTPATTTTAWTHFRLSVPTGFALAHLSVSASTASTDGLARFASVFGPDLVVVRNETLSAQRVTAYVTLARA